MSFVNERNFALIFPQGHTLICTLEAGAAFGESILYDTPRNATVITSSSVMLLRVEQKDFKIIWEVKFLFREKFLFDVFHS